MKLTDLFGLLKQAGLSWYEDNTSRLGAALAYYTVFSLAPLLTIAVAVASLVYGEQAAQGRMAAELENAVGPQVAAAVQEIVGHAHARGTGTLAAVLSFAVLLFSATAVFVQLQDGLNTVWGVKPKPGRGWLDAVKDRAGSFALVLGVGFLLLASLVIATALEALGKFFPADTLPAGVYLWQAVNLVVSLGLATVLFAMIYKVLPDVEITWRDVWVGAAVTAVLFTLGKYLIGLYLGRSGAASAYGAAGSLVVILLWVYYSSQILFFGAEFTRAYANKYGRPMVRADRAEPVTAEARARQGLPPTEAGVAQPGDNL